MNTKLVHTLFALKQAVVGMANLHLLHPYILSFDLRVPSDKSKAFFLSKCLGLRASEKDREI